MAVSKQMRVLFVLVGLLLMQGAVHARTLTPWTVLKDSVRVGEVQARAVGDAEFLDALTMSDIVSIQYKRDELDRYVFSFPELPVLFVPDGAFVQVGMEMTHLTVPVFRENYRLFVPDELFLDLLQHHYHGTVKVDSAARLIRYRPASDDLVHLDGWSEGEDWTFRVTLGRSIGGTIELEDSCCVLLRLDDVTLAAKTMTVFGEDSVRAEVAVCSEDRTIHFELPKPVAKARLVGPDEGNTLQIALTLSNGDEIAGSRAYGDRILDEVLAEEKAKWTFDTIVIDPGHGGKDPGAIGHKKTYEKNVVLDVSLKLKAQIQKRLPGVKVVMTRDKDVFLPLGTRTKIANREKGKLFISIHANANRSRRARGMETYFLSPARTERAMQVALKENSVIRYEEKREDYPDLAEENFILIAMAQSQYVKESETFATMIQNKMEKRTGLYNRGVDQANFYVLIGASMPAVLVETAFITNPKEESLLRKATFRNKLAAGICDAIIDFMNASGE